MFRLWCILIGYFLGSISVAYIVGKVRGIDIREHGSGNAGTTNTLRVLGRRAGAIVLAGDLLKCFVAMIVCWLIFKNSYPDMKYLIRIYAAAGTILGHDYPFFLKFKGGKGIACFVGMIAFFYPGVIPAEVAIFFGIFFTTHFVSLSSMFLALGFLAQVVIFGQFGFYGLSSTQLLELYITVGFLVALCIFQHRKNIANLVNGLEKKTYLSKKKAPAEIDLEKTGEEAKKAEEEKKAKVKEIKPEEGKEEVVEETEDFEKTLRMDREMIEEKLKENEVNGGIEE
jgi:glycerol-3-phosphate acyltransferase PlsY